VQQGTTNCSEAMQRFVTKVILGATDEVCGCTKLIRNKRKAQR
jgi:hypothetical protein